MGPSTRLAKRFVAAIVVLLAVSPSPGRAEGEALFAAVSSRVSDDYARERRPDGSFVPEAYAFGPGGHWGGAMGDDSIDHLKFSEIARTIAVPLAAQNYVPAKDPAKTRLLIMVYWGTTEGSRDTSSSMIYANLAGSQVAAIPPPPGHGPFDIRKSAQQVSEVALLEAELANERRDRIDVENARLLGYDSAGIIGTDYGRGLELTALRFRARDLIEEIEDSRYFVVLMAYDFQLMWKEQKHKLLWETRYSIRQRRHRFDEQLANMTCFAMPYFGQSSHGLIRNRVPDGKVTVGDLKVLGTTPEKK